jgi:hypothetical protein
MLCGRTAFPCWYKKQQPTLRSGISRSSAPELPHRFHNEIQEDPEEKVKRNDVRSSLRTRAVQMLWRANDAACFPVALAALPYVKYRRLAGAYWYCLARKLD